MPPTSGCHEELLAENERLRLRLEEAEATVEAIRNGLVDAVVVSSPIEGIYTLEGADRPYRLLVEAMQQGVAVVSREGLVLYCNPSFAELLRRPLEDVIGARADDLVAGAGAAWAEFVAVVEHGPARREFRLRRHDGSEVPVAIAANVLPAKTFSLHVTDLSQQLQFEELVRSKQALQEREHFLQRIAAITPGLLYVFDLAEGREVFINRSVASLLGFSPEEAQAIGTEAVRSLMHPDDRLRFEQHLGCVRSLADGEVADFEYRMCDRAGQWNWFHGSDAVFARDEKGAVRQLIGVATDITQQKRSETVLKASEVRYRRLFESAKDGILILDAHTATITDANPFIAELLGYSQDELVGNELWQIGLFKDVQASKEAMEELQRESYKRYDDLPLETKAGRRINVEFVSNVYREDGEAVIQCNIRDITERKRLEESLQQHAADLFEADRRKDEFLATLAHELRNPLAPIRNGLQILHLMGNDRDAVQRTLAMMERQLNQMVHLVDDLLDLSRISRGILELRKQRIELTAVLNNAVETSRPLIEACGHELTVVVPPEPVCLDADLTRLGQVFSNLLNNAAKYSEPGQQIRLAAELQGSDVVVSVKDAGVGIAPEMLPTIFEMFTQADRSLEKAQGGLGIGLCLVKRLVEMHGGRVEARSEGHGQGSEFVVRLPVVLSVAPQGMPPADDNETANSSGQRRILVADDNRDAADSLAMLLRIMGNEVRTANDGMEAVDVAMAFRPNVILLDIGMPKLNGYEACRCIREQPWGEQAVLVALTGWGQDEDRRRSKEASFDHHLVKPLDHATLEKLLSGLQAQGKAWLVGS